jgi:hypothetical protein
MPITVPGVLDHILSTVLILIVLAILLVGRK